MSEETNKELSKEEVAAMRKRMIDNYKEQVTLLKHQHEYEKLLAEIEEFRAKRVAMTIRIAQMMAGPQEEEAGEMPEQEQPEAPVEEQPRAPRKLKKQD